MSEDLRTGSQRIYIVGKVKISSPFHIGSGETIPQPDRPDTDIPIKLNSDGKPYLPATSIGGLLRGTAANLVASLNGWSNYDVYSLFGTEREKEEANLNHPSRLRLHDAQVEAKWNRMTWVRDGVGIDRQRASARAGALYNYEVVPAGQEFSLCIELRDGSDRDKQLLALTLDALQQLPTAIGARGNSGLGSLSVNIEKVVTLDLTDCQTLFKFLHQDSPFDLKSESGESWKSWRKNHLPKPVVLKTDKNQLPNWRIPQSVTFTYRLKVKDPLLIRGREAPESALQDYQERKKEASFGDDMKGIDAVWIGQGDHPTASNWEPIIPGSSLRGVFRSYCERILRTLWWNYAGKDKKKYERKVIASDPLLRPSESKKGKDYHLRSSGFEIQDEVSDKWQKKVSAKDIAQFIWNESDLGERMWGSAQWKSRVMVSEAVIPSDYEDEWKEFFFQNVAINRFTGGASEQKLFNALAVTHGVFEGSITVFGDELWMSGLIALLFKDLTDELDLVRAGSGKTRGRGSFDGWLEKIEVKALPGSKVTEICKADQPADGRVWITMTVGKNDLGQFPKVNGWLKNLLEEGVKQLNKKVQAYAKEEGNDVRDNSSQASEL